MVCNSTINFNFQEENSMTMNNDINETIDKSVKRKSVFPRILKYLLIFLGSMTLLILSIGAWIYFSLFAGPGPMEISDFHPFKSAKAKAAYFSFENKLAKKWPIASEEKIVKTSFGKTFMRISGPVDAPPLVLLPGGGTCSLIWRENIKALSEEYRTYALDNIYDFGRSIYTRKIENGKDFSDWLNELFDTLHLANNIRIMGYSYGGWVTSQYALYHSERVNHVVLIAPAWTVLDFPGDFVLSIIPSLLPIRYFKEKTMYRWWKDLSLSGDRGKQIVEDEIDYYEITMKCFKLKQGVLPTVLSDTELQTIKMPVLFLVGENETCYNGKDAINRLNKVAPEIETELINGTGHDLMFTHTDMINKRILEFLKR
jgi:pimeloyl-ACP methyl ester carboxylesterase